MINPDEALDTLAAVAYEHVDGDRDGHRPRDERDLLEFERIDHEAKVVAVRRERVAIGSLARVSSPTQVERDDIVVRRETDDLLPPEGSSDRPTRHEQHDRSPTGSLVVQRHAVGKLQMRHGFYPSGSGAMSSASQIMIVAPPVAKFGTSANAAAISGESSATCKASSSSK